MKYGKIHLIIIFLPLFISIFMTCVFAGTTGKIMGIITDKATDEPLIGCNVMVKETNLGAATDMNGKYIILQVPPGNFDVVVHYMGYHSLTVTDVTVRIDLTTTVNFQLESNVIEAPTVTVVAEKSMVQKDVTSTSRHITSQDIMETPGIESTADILQRQGGFFTPMFSEQVSIGGGINIEPKDPSLKGINIRGSRGGDALILIDGFPSNHPVYGGYDIMNLNVEDIQNIEILTGAFSAEYGQGESAVINITTKSGSDRYTGSVNFRSDAPGLWGDSYDKDRLAINLSGPDIISKKLLPFLGIKIPGKINFFSTITATLTNTPYNNQRIRDPLFSIGSLSLDERQDNSLSYSLKLNYQISNNFKTRLSYRRSASRWTQYEWLWKNNPDNLTRYNNSNEQLQLNFTHTLSTKTFYSLTAGYTDVKYQNNYNGRNPSDFWIITPDTMYSIIMAPNVDPVTGFYDERGYISNWAKSDDKVYSVKFDLTSQILTEHLIKIGAQFDYKELYNMNITAGGTGLSEYGRFLYQDASEYPPPPGPFKEFGSERWLIEGNPITGGIYITDKFELESLILNAGVRCDWLIPGKPTNDPEWKAQWERATGLKADWSDIIYQIDPRFGVSFPISVNTVFYFSYGHFNTLPGMENYLRDPYSGGFTGNPHLKYVKTVKNEFGFTYQFAPNWAIDIKNYNKEISGQIGTTQLKTEYGLPISLSDNKGYTRVRGLEFNLKKQTSGYFGGDIIYTMQWVNGYSSSSFDDYRRSLNNLPNPIEENRLNWDMRHQVIFRGNISIQKGKHPRIFKLKIPDCWNIALQSQFFSGTPYTPGTHDPALRQVLENSKEGPLNFRADMKIEKYFQFGRYKLNIGIDIDNLFNEYVVNTQRNEYTVGSPDQPYFNIWTGKPYTYGDKIQNTNQGYDYYDMLLFLDPRRFGEGRHVDFILEFHW